MTIIIDKELYVYDEHRFIDKLQLSINNALNSKWDMTVIQTIDDIPVILYKDRNKIYVEKL